MSRSGRGRVVLRRLARWCAAAGVLVVFFAFSPPAQAHSTLVRSDPADGSTVEVGRTELTLWFEEPIVLRASTFQLRTEQDVAVPTTLMSRDPTDFVELRTPPLRRGVLVLRWEAVSAEDGHEGTGSLTFGVGTPPPLGAAAQPAAPRPSEVLLRWGQLSTLTLGIGLVLAQVVLRRGSRSSGQSDRRDPARLAVRLGPVVGLAALLTTALAPMLSPRSADLLGVLTSTRWGPWWILELVALSVVTSSFAVAVRHPGRRPVIVAALALCVATTADIAAGHAADLPRQSAVAVVAGALHLLAVGAWVGTLGVLALCLLPAMVRHPETRRPLLASTWRAFSPIAGVSVVLLAASGLYLAGRHLPSLDAVLQGWYGAVLLAKTIALAAALLLAGGTTLIVNPSLASGLAARRPLALRAPALARFPRRVATELAVLGTALLLAAVMTTVPTARAGQDRAPAQVATASADGLFVSFESVSAGEDQQRLIVLVNAVTRPQPGPVTSVDALLVGAGGRSTTVPLQLVERGRFESTAPAGVPSSYRVWVSVQRDGAPDAVAKLRWNPVASDASASEFEMVMTLFAGGLVVAGAAAGLLLLVRWRRRDQARLSALDGLPPVPGDGSRVPVAAGESRES